jgi:hypothetical protein
VALVRVELAYGAGAEALLQAVNELGQGLGRVMPEACFQHGRRVHGEPGLPVVQRLGDGHVEGGGLEAEPDIIEGIGHAIEAQPDEARDVANVAAGSGEADLDRLHAAVQMEQHEAYHARSGGGAFEIGNERMQEPRGSFQDMLPADDGLYEHGLRAIDRRGHGGDERLGGAPQGLVEAQEEGLEAGGERRARLTDHVADAAQPQAAEQRQRTLRQPQSCEREGGQGPRLSARRDNDTPGAAMMCHGPGCAGGAGDGEARGEAEGGEAALEISEQRRLAAEKMGRAGDVDEEAVSAVRLAPRGHDGRVAQGPQGEPAQGHSIGGRVGFVRLQIEHLGAGVGDEVSHAEAALPGGAVECDDARPAWAGGDEGEGAERVKLGACLRVMSKTCI